MVQVRSASQRVDGGLHVGRGDFGAQVLELDEVGRHGFDQRTALRFDVHLQYSSVAGAYPVGPRFPGAWVATLVPWAGYSWLMMCPIKIEFGHFCVWLQYPGNLETGLFVVSKLDTCNERMDNERRMASAGTIYLMFERNSMQNRGICLVFTVRR